MAAATATVAQPTAELAAKAQQAQAALGAGRFEEAARLAFACGRGLEGFGGAREVCGERGRLGSFRGVALDAFGQPRRAKLDKAFEFRSGKTVYKG